MIKGKSPHKYTPKELRFIRDNFEVLIKMGREHMLEMFNRQFNCSISTKEFDRVLRNWGKLLFEIGNGRNSIGAEHRKDQYVMVKTGYPSIWRKKHHVIWEAANGPIPDGHAIIFADRNKLNFDLKNLILVSRRELDIMNRKHLVFPDAELTRDGLLIAKIIIQINDRAKGKRPKHEN